MSTTAAGMKSYPFSGEQTLRHLGNMHQAPAMDLEPIDFPPPMRQLLDEATERLWLPIPQGKNIGVCSVYLPQDYLGRLAIIPAIEQSLARCMDSDSLILFIASEAEQELAEKCGFLAGEQSKPAMGVKTYHETLDIFEKNRSASGPAGWKEPQQLAGWHDSGILPRKVTVVVSLDPSMPVECALSLVALTHWAFEVSAQPGFAIRIVAMAPDPHHTALRRLVALYAPDMEWHLCDLGSLDNDDPTHGCEIVSLPDEGVVPDILDRIQKAGPGTTHAVLCFAPLEQDVSPLYVASDSGEEPNLVSLYLHPWTPPARICEIHSGPASSSSSPPSGHLIMMDPRGPHIKLKGFSHAYVILGQMLQKSRFGGSIAQVSLFECEMSLGERKERLSWCRQPEVGTTAVYTPFSSVDSFLKAGERIRHVTKIEGLSAGGFIIGVCRLATWGIHILKALKSFVGSPQLIEEMMDRLRVQGLISRHGYLLNMPQVQETTFMTVLPYVGYDHHLAHFIALPSNSIYVVHVKIQLAVLLMLQIDEIVIFTNPESLEPASRESFIDSCCGWARPLAHTGTMWLMLGLWKRAARLTREFTTLRGVEEVVRIPGCDVEVDQAMAIRALHSIHMIHNALDEQGIDVGIRRDISDETGMLSAQECLDLQQHLFEAFIHQLTVTFPTPDGGLRHQIISTVTNVVGINDGVPRVVDIKGILEEQGTSCIFAICRDLQTTLDDVHAMDWTWIPISVVQEWKLAHSPDETLHSALATGVPRQA